MCLGQNSADETEKQRSMKDKKRMTSALRILRFQNMPITMSMRNRCFFFFFFRKPHYLLEDWKYFIHIEGQIFICVCILLED